MILRRTRLLGLVVNETCGMGSSSRIWRVRRRLVSVRWGEYPSTHARRTFKGWIRCWIRSWCSSRYRVVNDLHCCRFTPSHRCATTNYICMIGNNNLACTSHVSPLSCRGMKKGGCPTILAGWSTARKKSGSSPQKWERRKAKAEEKANEMSCYCSRRESLPNLESGTGAASLKSKSLRRIPPVSLTQEYKWCTAISIVIKPKSFIKQQIIITTAQQ